MRMPLWTLALTFVFVQVSTSPGKIFFPDGSNRSKDPTAKTKTTTSSTAAATEDAKQGGFIDARLFGVFKEEEEKEEEKEEKGEEEGKEAQVPVKMKDGGEEKGTENVTVTLENMPEEIRSQLVVIDGVYRSGMLPCMSQVMLLLDRTYYFNLGQEMRSCYYVMAAVPRSNARLRLSCNNRGQGIMFRHRYPFGRYYNYPYYNNDYCYNSPKIEVYSDNWFRPQRYCQGNSPSTLDSRFNWMAVIYTNNGPWRANHLGLQCSVVAYDVRIGPRPVPTIFPTTFPTTRLPTSFSTIQPIPTTQSPLRCNCGHVRTAFTRIAGGKATSVNKYPWMAALAFTNTFRPFCSGSLINTRWVLTAGHCVLISQSRESQAILGEHDLSTPNETDKTEIISISSAITHPDFNFERRSSDIGLLRLARAPDTVSPSAVIEPICLLQAPLQTVTSIPAIIAGWGDNETGLPADKLQEANVTLYSNVDCGSRFTLPDPLPANTVCTWAGGRDSCSGDSGGPVFSRANNDLMFQIGIISYGPTPCVSSTEPGVNTRVSAFLSWIKNEAGSIPICSP